MKDMTRGRVRKASKTIRISLRYDLHITLVTDVLATKRSIWHFRGPKYALLRMTKLGA